MNTRLIEISWSKFLGCSVEELLREKTISFHRSSFIAQNEFYITSWIGWWTLISMNLETKNKKITTSDSLTYKTSWTIQTMYLLDNTKKYQKINSQIKKLNSTDAETVEEFFKFLPENEKNTIYIDLNNIKQQNYWLFNTDNKLVSVGNYQLWASNQIANLWIATLPKQRKKWHAKRIVKFMLNELREKWIVPQWRVDITNIKSIMFAKSLWFKENHQSLSIYLN